MIIFLYSRYKKTNGSFNLDAIFAFGTDLEWKLIYVGSAEDETYDQLLESVLVGPVNVGNYRFVLQVTYAFASHFLASIVGIATEPWPNSPLPCLVE